MAGKSHEKCGASARQKKERDKQNRQSDQERNCSKKNVVEDAVPSRGLGRGVGDRWRPRRGLRRYRRWRRRQRDRMLAVRTLDRLSRHLRWILNVPAATFTSDLEVCDF
jgi:hypothetical protein